MPIPIRIHNDGAKEICVVQVDRNDKQVVHYRIAPGQLGPTMNVEQPGLHSGHALIIGEDELFFISARSGRDTDANELAPAEDDGEETKA